MKYFRLFLSICCICVLSEMGSSLFADTLESCEERLSDPFRYRIDKVTHTGLPPHNPNDETTSDPVVGERDPFNIPNTGVQDKSQSYNRDPSETNPITDLRNSSGLNQDDPFFPNPPKNSGGSLATRITRSTSVDPITDHYPKPHEEAHSHTGSFENPHKYYDSSPAVDIPSYDAPDLPGDWGDSEPL